MEEFHPILQLRNTQYRLLPFLALLLLVACERPATEPSTQPARIPVLVGNVPPDAGKYATFQQLGAADADALAEFRVLLDAETVRWPAALVQEAQLKRIALVKNLAVTGQERFAMPDAGSGTLYFDIYHGRTASAYQRHCIHHEFHHLVDFGRTGNFYPDDREWVALNPPGTRYGTGGANARESHVTVLNHPADGFVNEYAMSAQEEDRAEIFAVLMVPDERKLVEEWAETDTHLAAKIRMMEKRIAVEK